MKCPQCHFENPDDSSFCSKCGTQISSRAEIPFSKTETLQMPTEELARGSVFAGRYEIIEELGQGGMGRVYRVFDKKIEGEVALKLLKPEIASDKKTIGRFRNELKIARGIAHRNVCRMYDLNEEKGTHYITMEYVQGEDLKSFIRRAAPLGLGKAIAVGKQACEGLAEAHRLGIVHRDLKPQNIMIDKDGNARIMDFGIARSLKGKGITAEGVIIGTPDYMSPEQVEGKEADERADIYSLGVILYEMLTGRVPFSGDTPFSVAYKHKNEYPRDPREINSHIPEGLSSIILRCLEKDRAKRYQTAEEFSAALAEVEKSLPATDTSLSKEKPKKRPSKKLWRSLLVPALACLGVLLALGSYFLLRRSQPSAKSETAKAAPTEWKNSIAVLPFQDLSPQKDQEPFCDGMTNEIIVKLSQFQDLKVTSTNSVMRYKDTNKDNKQIARELGVINIVEGRVQREGRRIRVSTELINPMTNFAVWSETYDRELSSLFDVQDEISQSLSKALKVKILPETAEATAEERPKSLEAYEYYMKGMHFIKSNYVISFKEDDFKAGVDMFNKAIELDPNYAMAYFGLGWAYEHHYQATGNELDAEQMQKKSEMAFQLDPHSALTNAVMAYTLYEYKGEREKAFGLLKKALEINPNISEVNFITGICFLYHGLYGPGIKYLTKAEELDPYYFWTPYKLAYCYMYSGEFEKAAFYFEKYFELTPIEPLIFPGRYTALNIMMKRYDKAKEIVARGEKTDPKAEWVLKYRAILAAIKGEKEEALGLYKNSEVFALLGMKDEAFIELNKEIRGSLPYPYIFYQDLIHNPFYDRLRGDARFKVLLEKEKKLYEDNLKKYGTF